MPLGIWALFLLAAGVTLMGRGYSAPWRDEAVLLLLGVSTLAFVSSQVGFNSHSRYVLPCLPFLFVWTGKMARSFDMRRTAMSVAVAGATLCGIASSIAVYPHSLSYFNELAGGPACGHAHLLGSNISWEQDLFFLQQWFNEHQEARPMYLAVNGPVNPTVLGIEFTLPPLGPSHPRTKMTMPPESLGPGTGLVRNRREFPLRRKPARVEWQRGLG